MAADTRPALWLVDKPAGPTSHDIVARVRRRLGRGVKVGHAGTLDPFATGLLVVLSGRATRLAAHMTGLDKRYLVTMRTGYTSATGDPEGPVEMSGAPAGGDAIAGALEGFRGRQRQRVPAYAAVKVDGERMYARARRGEEVEAPEREIVIHALDLLEDLGDGSAALAVHCSKGTYIRRLVMDIGAALGCGAYCTALRRTHVGSLSVDDAVAPGDIRPGEGRDPAEGLTDLPRLAVTPDEAVELGHGRPIRRPDEGEVVLLCEGRLIALGRGGGDGWVRPHLVLRPAGER
ncbi:MAG: tRNA pseudouridine(55) synthase TruB [Thermoleophilia bacterium]